MILLNRILLSSDVSLLKNFGMRIYIDISVIINHLKYDLRFQSESPFTIEESITLMNYAICLSNVKAKCNFLLYNISTT